MSIEVKTAVWGGGQVGWSGGIEQKEVRTHGHGQHCGDFREGGIRGLNSTEKIQ